jgi:hypothetical protein
VGAGTPDAGHEIGGGFGRVGGDARDEVGRFS